MTNNLYIHRCKYRKTIMKTNTQNIEEPTQKKKKLELLYIGICSKNSFKFRYVMFLKI